MSRFCESLDVLTFEFENVSLDIFNSIACCVRPGISALKIAQDRQLEKEIFTKHSIPTPDYKVVHTCEQLKEVLSELKTGVKRVVKHVAGL